MTESRAITIAGDGPQAGWAFHISHVRHDVDRMEDLYTVALWPPEAIEPTHQFNTYRHGYGWTVLNAALTAADEHADARMQAALDWWTEHHSSAPYQIHRILVAIDDTTWATRAEIAQRLSLDPKGLNPDSPYGEALATAERLELITTWRNLRSQHPYAALTPAGYDLIHPDDRAAGRSARRRLQTSLNIGPDPVGPHAAPSAAGRAFAPTNQVDGPPSAGGGHSPTITSAAPPRTRPAR